MSNSLESIKVIESALPDVAKVVVTKRNNVMSSEIAPIAIPFLIEVGRFAMNELRERWKISRKDKSDTAIDLSNEEEIKTKTPSQLNDPSNALAIRKILQEHHLSLERQMVTLPRDRTLVKEAADAGKILVQHRARQLEEIEERIRETARENERIIEQLGFQISKENLE